MVWFGFFLLNVVQVTENKSAKSDIDYVTYKRRVWHECFRRILEPVKSSSLIGFWFRCGDQVLRNFFIFVVILSADYEELYVCYLTKASACLYRFLGVT